MTVNVDNFLLSLAVALAAQASPALAMADELWIHQAVETSASTGAYAVLSIYGGPAPDGLPGAFDISRPQTRSVQCMATAKEKSVGAARAASKLAERVYASVYDADELVRHYWLIPAKEIDPATGAIIAATDGLGDWQVQLITVNQPPGKIGVDEQGRVNWSFNFDVRFERKE